ncbi:MAG: hypothetical protein WC736_15770 [Gallionella sp.]|jgi:hypothetical protein
MTDIVFPIGRFIGGSLKDLHARTEQDGKTPVLGTDGKPMMACNFGIAIPKTQADWRNEVWGKVMFEIAKAAEPILHQSPSFAYKIVNGDDTLPNKNGKVPSQQEGYAGHWVLWFSQGWLPKLCSADGSVELQPGSIVPGQYVQVLGDISSNGAKPPKTPGLYLNPKAVALAADGPRITTNDIDTTKVGFGGALPAGAQPLKPAEAAFAAPAVPVTPNAAFMAPPAPPAVPAGPVMTAKANGASYQQMIEAGWNDALLKQHGMIA